MSEIETDELPEGVAWAALRELATASEGVPGDEWLALDEWMAQAGLPVEELGRVAEWVAQRRLSAIRWGERVYLPRPSWAAPPPGYITVRQYAARNGVSDNHVYNLINRGHLSPVWKAPVREYHHFLVASWAEIREAA